MDDNDGANGDQLFTFVEYDALVDFTPLQSDTMQLRFGYLNAGNNWWFAVDNVLVEADTIDYVKGDANQNGTTNTLDLSVFVSAILDPTGYQGTFGADPNVVFDFNCDGSFNTLDISGFINVILGN